MDKNGNIAGFIWFGNDVTSKKKAEMKIIEMNKGLEETIKERVPVDDVTESSNKNISGIAKVNEKLVKKKVLHEGFIKNSKGFIFIKPLLYYFNFLNGSITISI